MPALTLYTSGRLTASRDDRTVRGRLLPFGEPGYTSRGKVRARAGVLKAAARMSLNVEHNRTAPVGIITDITETADGIDVVARILATRAGDDALLEVAEGVRACLSVEIDDPIIRDGELLGGLVSGGALVVEPAFPSARLAAADAPFAPDEGTPPEDEEEDDDEEDPDAVVVEEHVDVNVTTYTDTDTDTDTTIASTTHTIVTQEEPPMPNPSAPVTVTPGTLSANRPTDDLNALYAALTTFGVDQDRSRLVAALSVITPANILGVEQPQYVGQLWDGAPYERRYIPLWGTGPLTSFKVAGWKWKTKPQVGPYAGNATDIPSGPVETESADVDATRFAGGHKIDRKHKDFPNHDFWQAYLTAMTESYKKVTDTSALATVVAASRAVQAAAGPAGIPAGLVSIVDGALSVLNATDTMPTYALVATDLWRTVVLTPKDYTLEYLTSAIGLKEGDLSGFRIVPSSAIAAGKVQVGVRSAVTVRELPGPAPIRVSAEDVARGALDEALFGYMAVQVHDNDGLVLVTKPV